MGGSIKKEFKKEVTHVIAKTVRGDKYRYSANMGLPILSDEWIDNAWNNRHVQNFSIESDMVCYGILLCFKQFCFIYSIILRFLQVKYKVPPFFSCHIAFVGFQPEDEKHMKEMAVKYGILLNEIYQA